MKTLNTDKRRLAWIVLALTMPLLASCGGNYYQVTAAGNDKAYYTRDVDHEDGHLRFTDKATGDKVILDNAEVRKITEEQYENAVRK